MGKNTGRANKASRKPRRSARPKSARKAVTRYAAPRKSRRPVRGVDRDPGRAQRVIDFIEKLTIPSGVGAGGPFKLREWQKDFIRDIYEPHKGGKRLVRTAILSIARKNGKTPLVAAICLAHLVGPEAELNGEIFSAATEREQAAQTFKYAKQMVAADAELSSLLKVVDSTKTIACYGNGSFYKALSSEAGTKHGGNATFVVYDELAQARDRKLFDVLDTAVGAREEPLMYIISTQSPDPEHVLSQLIDDGLNAGDPTVAVHLYAVDDEVEDIYDEAAWYQANPALGDFRNLDEMRQKARRAQRMPGFEPAFRNLYINQRVDAKASLIPKTEWMACAGDRNQLRPGEAIWLGLDLSQRTDLTALAAVSAEDGDRVQCWFWKPEGQVDLHEKRDRVPYRKWIQEGWLEATPGRAVDYDYVVQQIAEIGAEYEICGIAFDRWNIANFLKSADNMGVDMYDASEDGVGFPLVRWGQGFQDMGPAVDEIEISVLERNLLHPGNPLLTWCVANAIAKKDPAGNRKFDKQASRFRIDGAVALAMAMGLKARMVMAVQGQPRVRSLG